VHRKDLICGSAVDKKYCRWYFGAGCIIIFLPIAVVNTKVFSKITSLQNSNILCQQPVTHGQSVS